MKVVTIPALSDLHAHYRQGLMLPGVCSHTTRYAGRTLAMPNTTPPVCDAVGAMAYGARLRSAMPDVDVLVASKLLPETTPDQVLQLGQWRAAAALKLYPAGATTNSGDGVPHEALADPERHTWLGDLCDAAQRAGLVLCLHGEMPRQSDPLLREACFLPFVGWLLGTFPRLRVVLEHITTVESVDFVTARHHAGARVAATITLHHLMLHLGHVLGTAWEDEWGYGDGKLHPHNFCWPVAKQPHHREALVGAACSGLPCFFMGSDSAPHAAELKENACGCAGVFSAPVLPEALVQFFLSRDALDKLPGFATRHGDRFYDREPVERTLRLVREGWTVPPVAARTSVVPFLAGRRLDWTLDE